MRFDLNDEVYFDEKPEAMGRPGDVHVGMVYAVTGDTIFLVTPAYSRMKKGLFPVKSKQILGVRTRC